MKIFISQRMAGFTDEEIIARRREIMDFCKRKFNEPCEFIDSFTKNADQIKGGPISMLGDSISKMCDADLVVFDTRWYESRGCNVERMVCAEYRIPVYDIENPNNRIHKVLVDNDTIFWR